MAGHDMVTVDGVRWRRDDAEARGLIPAHSEPDAGAEDAITPKGSGAKEASAPKNKAAEPNTK